jgi:chromosome segregation ATPase
MAKTKAQSDEQRTLQEAIDALASVFRHRDEKKNALAATEQALVELDGALKNAEADLEAEITEASDAITEGEIALLSDRTDVYAERISRLKSQVGFHVKLRDKLKADLNAAAMAIKGAIDALELAKRPLLRQVSARLADEIDALEAKSSELRARLNGMANSAPGGLDGLSLRALHMVQNFAPPPTEIMVNSALWHRMLGWTAAYRNWRSALVVDPAAKPPEAP